MQNFIVILGIAISAFGYSLIVWGYGRFIEHDPKVTWRTMWWDTSKVKK